MYAILQSCVMKRLHSQIAKGIPVYGNTCCCFKKPGFSSFTQDKQTLSRNFSVLQQSRTNTVTRLWNVHKTYIGQLHVTFYSTDIEVEEIDYEGLRKKIKESRVILIDVREPKELEERGSYSPYYSSVINIPLGDVEDALSMSELTFQALYKAQLPDIEDSEIIFSCAMGIRSMRAATLAKQLGFERVKSYKGGFEEWREKNQENFEK